MGGVKQPTKKPSGPPFPDFMEFIRRVGGIWIETGRTFDVAVRDRNWILPYLILFIPQTLDLLSSTVTLPLQEKTISMATITVFYTAIAGFAKFGYYAGLLWLLLTAFRCTTDFRSLLIITGYAALVYPYRTLVVFLGSVPRILRSFPDYEYRYMPFEVFESLFAGPGFLSMHLAYSLDPIHLAFVVCLAFGAARHARLARNQILVLAFLVWLVTFAGEAALRLLIGGLGVSG